MLWCTGFIPTRGGVRPPPGRHHPSFPVPSQGFAMHLRSSGIRAFVARDRPPRGHCLAERSVEAILAGASWVLLVADPDGGRSWYSRSDALLISPFPARPQWGRRAPPDEGKAIDEMVRRIRHTAAVGALPDESSWIDSSGRITPLGYPGAEWQRRYVATHRCVAIDLPRP
jgi:hypothetical protein